MIINNYTVKEKIYEGQDSILYVCNKENDNNEYIVKMLAKSPPMPEDIEKFNLEFKLLNILKNTDGIPKTFGIEKYNDTFIIVMEYFKGKSISTFLTERNLSISEFIDLSIKIIDILSNIHKKRIIHKDINPSNILWNIETNEVKIIDFGISSLLDENQNSVDANVLEGTLAYISPEQTGRMKRNIDFRSDFYSLGCTFYEMLTGKKPFESTDMLELIHCHMAKFPITPIELDNNIPKPISDIVMKLIQKNPEERYQSLFGLKYDLENCLKSSNFIIGQKDISEKFEIPKKVYGRENEINDLTEGLKYVKEYEDSQIILINGPEGIGKTALVEEFQKNIVGYGAKFINGKFEERSQTIPYIPIKQIFDSFIKQILSENEESLNKWKKRILESVGNLGQVISDIIPQIELVIGKQPPLLELDPTRAQNRFINVFQNFLKAIATKENPLIIFIDDMQLADQATLNIIQSFITEESIKNILFVFSYRNEEVNDSHIFSSLINNIIQSGKSIFKIIKLSPLSEEIIQKILIDMFRSTPEKTNELAEVCFRKTLGNPFFMARFITAVYEKNLITFDSTDGIWEWDIEKINRKEISDNVISIMTEKIEKLPWKVQEVLKIASCIGESFNLSVLSAVCEKMKIEISQILQEAVNEGLICIEQETYPTLDEENSNTDIIYRFSHNRIRQSAYKMLYEKFQKEYHYKIGIYYLNRYSDENLLIIANHLNTASDLIDKLDEKQKLIEINTFSARKAKNTAAYEIAYNYIKNGLKLISLFSWETHYKLNLEFYLEASEIAYLCGNYEEMKDFIKLGIENVIDIVDRVKFDYIYIKALIAQNKRFEAVQFGISSLELLNVKIKNTPSKLDIVSNMLKVKRKLKNKKIEDIVNMPLLNDDKANMAIRILAIILSPAYHINSKIMLLIGFKIVELSLIYGNTQTTSSGYIALALSQMVMNHFNLGYNYAEIGLKLIEKFNGGEGAPFFYFSLACFIDHFRKPLIDVLDVYRQGYNKGIETGDPEFTAYNICYCLRYSYFAGVSISELDNENCQVNNLLEKLKQSTVYQVNKMNHQVVLNMYNVVRNPCDLSNDLYSETDLLKIYTESKNRTNLFGFHFYKMHLNYLFYNKDEALYHAKKSREYSDSVPASIFLNLMYFYESLVYLDNFNKMSNKDKKKYLKIIHSNLTKLKTYSKHCPSNQEHKYLLIEAELAKLKNDTPTTMEYYDKAIELSIRNGFTNEEALACERAGLYYLNMGRKNIAHVYFNKALLAYSRWGAKSKVLHLEETYSELKLQTNRTLKNSTIVTTKTTTLSTTFKNTDSIDLTSVIKASQAISGEIEYNKLIEKLVKVIAENSGAERIIIIGINEKGLTVEAEYNICNNMLKITNINEDDHTFKLILPESIVKFVERTKELVVLDDAQNNIQFRNDRYVNENNSKSILCMPLMYQGKLNRILYLENNNSTGIFTEERLEILNMISSQMVISIENSKIYEHLEEQVRNRTKELQEMNHRILESITYAKTIQQSILPPEEAMKETINAYFALWLPRDIVGGDIYWFERFEKGYLIGVIDCTGHGVPGAFMTMTANSVLNRITGEICHDNPARILNELNKFIRRTLKHDQNIKEFEDYDDGMDVGLCYIEPSNKRLLFAGAKIPLFLCDNEKVQIITGDKQGIGYRKSNEEFQFTNHEIKLSGNEIFYMSSDGFQDQQGGNFGFGIGKEKFKELLYSISRKDMEEQKKELKNFIEKYKGEYAQTDDITVVGFKPISVPVSYKDEDNIEEAKELTLKS